MKRQPSRFLTSAVAAIALHFATPAESQEAQGATTADRQQILSIVASWEDNWNKHDMAAFGEQFHEDGVWVLWTGAIWTGRKAIADGHAEVHKTVFRNSTQRELVEELTFVGRDAALVRFCSMLHGDERSPDTFVRSRKVLLVTRRGGVWRVSLGQNTRLADSVPDSECFVALRKRFP